MTEPFSEERRQEWKERILQQKESGLSIQRWCSEKSITPHSFYYWKKKLFPQPNLNRSFFKEITHKTGHSGITIRYFGFSIDVGQEFDVHTLKECLEVLKELKC